MPSIPFVDLQAQYRTIQREVDAAIQQVLSHGQFILGKEVEEFEKAFAGFIGTQYAVGVSSGLDALRLALASLGIGPSDEVILPANSYVATAFAVSAVGATPILVDCDPVTYALEPSQMESAITPRTRAVIPVHLAGQPAEMDSILRIVGDRRLHVIEDAAQAHGAQYRNKMCGAFGAAGCFSFYPAKNLGAYGDGGMVTTNDSSLADRVRCLRHYGQRTRYEHVEKGLNARLDTLQAAVLQVKLRHLPSWNAARASHVERYKTLLKGVGDLKFQQRLPDSTHVYHLFMVETERRDALQKHLKEAGIETGIHYPRPIHLQPAYADLRRPEGSFPQAERLAKRLLSLPMFPELTDSQIDQVAGEIRRFFRSGS